MAPPPATMGSVVRIWMSVLSTLPPCLRYSVLGTLPPCLIRLDESNAAVMDPLEDKKLGVEVEEVKCVRTKPEEGRHAPAQWAAMEKERVAQHKEKELEHLKAKEELEHLKAKELADKNSDLNIPTNMSVSVLSFFAAVAIGATLPEK